MNAILKLSIRKIRLILFLGLLIWSAFIFFPCISLRNPIAYLIADQIYSTVCHQDPFKSFHCDNNFLFVCARCLGIYLGALTLSGLLLFSKKIFKLNLLPLIIAAIPMSADVVLVQLSIYEYSLIISFITGVLLGSTVFLYILSVIENSFLRK